MDDQKTSNFDKSIRVGLPDMPTDRRGFKIGIICALTLEADMVELVFDRDYWDDDGKKFGKAEGDPNTYSTGVISGHNVVLAHCNRIGSNHAAQVAASLRSSYPGIRIMLVVGICGAVPYIKEGDELVEVVLGDLFLSTAVIQFDLGRQGPSGFKRKDGLDGAGPVSGEIASLLGSLETHKGRRRFNSKLSGDLGDIQQRYQKGLYPGYKEDQLFDSNFIHTHREQCADCDDTLGICGKQCEELGCLTDARALKQRERLNEDAVPTVHFGYCGSSNTVLKSGKQRDELAKQHKIVTFEMEGSGVWNVASTIVIKAACDYADSHKNKKWQTYAAAVAAAGLKAFLYELEVPNKISYSENTTRLSDNVKSIPAADAQAKSEEGINEADLAIREYYERSGRLSIHRLSGKTLDMKQCYINLALMKEADNQKNRSDQPFALKARLNIEGEGKPMYLTDLLKEMTSDNNKATASRRIFVQGRAGIGKTTLCKKLVHEFLHEGFADKSFDRVLWLSLRSLQRSQAKYSWENLLQDAYGDDIEDYIEDWDDLVKSLAKNLRKKAFLDKTLLVFDGLDELSLRMDAGDKMSQFIERTICNAPNIILTSRPQNRVFNFGKFDLEVETIGFTEEQVNDYLERCLEDKTEVPRIKTMISDKPLIQALLRIPIQLDAFCCTWQPAASYKLPKHGTSLDTISSTDLATMTLLYNRIFVELCRKDIQRLDESQQVWDLGIADIELILANELLYLEEFAFQGLVNGIAEISSQHRDMLAARLRSQGVHLAGPHDARLKRLSFLRMSEAGRDSTYRNYYFIHLTFQEFFAARYFVKHWLGIRSLELVQLGHLKEPKELEPNAFLQEWKYDPRYNIFWRFVAGLMQTMRSSRSKAKPIVGFVREICSTPVDMIGRAHHRLLMYIWSELVDSTDEDIKNLRASLEDQLYNWSILESRNYEDAEYCVLCGEEEFPRTIICRLLDSAYTESVRVALKVLDRYRDIPLPIIRKVVCCQQNAELYSCGMSILDNQEKLPLEFLPYVLAYITHSSDIDATWLATRAFSRFPELPDEAVTILTRLMDMDDHPVQENILNLLAGHRYHSMQTLMDLMSLPDKREGLSRDKIANMLQDTFNLPQKVRLSDLLHNDDSNVRQLALRTFAECTSPNKDLLSEAYGFSQSPDPAIRVYASQMLGNSFKSDSNAKTEECIFMLLEDTDTDVRLSMIKSFQQPVLLPVNIQMMLVSFLQDDRDKLRSATTEVLCRCDKKIEHWYAKETASALLICVSSPNAIVRASGVKILATNESWLIQSEADLLKLILDPNVEIRKAALSTLEHFNLPIARLSTEFLDAIVDLINRPETECREEAMKALRYSSDTPETLSSSIIAWLDDPVADFRFFAIDSIGGWHLPRRALDHLLSFLIDDDEKLRSRVYYKARVDAANWERLNAWIKDEQCVGRMEVIKFVGNSYHPPDDVIETLIQCTKDADLQVCQAARQALGDQNHYLQSQPQILPALIKVKMDLILAGEFKSALNFLATTLEYHSPFEFSDEALSILARLLLDQESSSLAVELLYSCANTSDEVCIALMECLVGTLSIQPLQERIIKRPNQLPEVAVEKMKLYLITSKKGDCSRDPNSYEWRKPRPFRWIYNLEMICKVFAYHLFLGHISTETAIEVLNMVQDEYISRKLISELVLLPMFYQLVPSLKQEVWKQICEVWLEQAWDIDFACWIDKSLLRVCSYGEIKNAMMSPEAAAQFEEIFEQCRSDLGLPNGLAESKALARVSSFVIGVDLDRGG